MATQADSRINLRLQIMRFSRRAEQGDGHISRPMPSLIVEPADDAWSDMACHPLHFFMRRCKPALVSRLDGVTTGAEFRMIGKGNRHSPHSHRAGHKRSDRKGGNFTHRPAEVLGNSG